jgi:bifunctional UDP-N-acetylglucosamine pyrophosphorylase / glucosamine-1-phosphate N-acetyltransferase
MSHVAVVLAAGKSTRMKSRLPKAAHPIAGRPLLAHVLTAAAAAVASGEDAGRASDDPPLPDSEDHSTRLVVVLGHAAREVEQSLAGIPDLPPYHVVQQQQQLGTGDAVRSARDVVRSVGASLNGHGPATVLVLYGDTPLVRAETLDSLLRAHADAGATVSFLTGVTDRPAGYGRVVRDADGQVRGIVEERHATPEQRRIGEVNSGIYCFASDWLWSRLDGLRPHPSGEYYLTDLVDLAAHEGRTIATVSAPLSETAGVNDRIQLAEAEAIMRRRILDELMLSGVTVVDPASTFVDAGVRVGQDTTLHPFTTLRGSTVIGDECEIGPHSVIRDSAIGDRCTVLASWIEEAALASGVHVGPMSHLRPGARLARGVRIGNFAEVKNSTIGENVQMHHFSYAGDATIGARTNVGAGTITCNYDGVRKHHTDVGEDVFLGSDTLLIAPVTVGDGAQTGAGAVVKREVPPYGVAVGMPARVIRHREPNRSRESSQPDPATATSNADAGSTASATSAQSEPPPAEAQAPPLQSEVAPGAATPSQPASRHAQRGQGPSRKGKESQLDG